MKGVIILDRDGVLNEMVVDPEHGIVDSPLHPDQVKVFAWVPDCVRRLTESGYQLHIATNQPAAAKGKTTRQNLFDAHDRVLQLVMADGGIIVSSEICEDLSGSGSLRRKPEPGMLNQILSFYPPEIKATSWMVGDGVTDVQAGALAGIKTAYLGPRKCDACKIFDQTLNLTPDFWGNSLKAFTDSLA